MIAHGGWADVKALCELGLGRAPVEQRKTEMCSRGAAAVDAQGRMVVTFPNNQFRIDAVAELTS